MHDLEAFLRLSGLRESFAQEPEAAPPLLFHGTSVLAAVQILASNSMKAKAASGIEAAAVSLTTDAAIAREFAMDRDGREITRFNMMARGQDTAKSIKWVYDNYSGAVHAKKGVVFELSGDQLPDLEPYSHFGMEEGEYRAAGGIADVDQALLAFYASSEELREWADRLPKKAGLFLALLSHPKFKDID